MQSNKAVIKFIIKFIGTYVLLFSIYAFYLNKSEQTKTGFSCDGITTQVAKQSNFFIRLLGFNSEIQQNTNELSYQIYINKQPIARVIEGCNAASIIILFIAFIVAFSTNFKSTFLYLFIGSLLIYGINVIRIGIITIALYKFPAYQYILHDIIFPGFIYGFTFLLWIIWVTKFLKIKKNE